MQRRAELVDATRRRIVEAAARLHTTIGPANTTIAAIAAEADVTRLTVYRHFPQIDELFVACRSHWRSTHPGPDVEAWRAGRDLEARARRAFGDLYGWYAENGADLFPIFRDLDAMPPSWHEATLTQNARLADAIVGDDPAGPRVRALARHFVTFRTWHSLTHEQALESEDAAELAVAALTAVRHEEGDRALGERGDRP